jgi:hypothetical protein
VAAVDGVLNELLLPWSILLTPIHFLPFCWNDPAFKTYTNCFVNFRI